MQELISKTISTGVYVITVRKGDIINGMTAAWVTQVSFKPHMLTVAIAPSRYTHGLIQESGYFCVNALPDNAAELAKHFGFKSGRKTDKFKGVNYTNAMKGSPILEDAYAYLECHLVSTCEAGDHTLFNGAVIDSGELKPEAKPLIFRWSDFFGKRG